MDCPNVAKTRNGMPSAAWKKYVNFASKNLPPSVYSGTFLFSGIPVILLIKAKLDMLIAAVYFISRIPDRIRDYTYKSYCGRDHPESSAVPRRSAGSGQSPADVKSGSDHRPPDP